MINEHACSKYPIRDKFAMEKWDSAEDFSSPEILSQGETTLPLEKRHMDHSPEITVTNVNFISPREKNMCNTSLKLMCLTGL
jgi:hypothetical protein